MLFYGEIELNSASSIFSEDCYEVLDYSYWLFVFNEIFIINKYIAIGFNNFSDAF